MDYSHLSRESLIHEIEQLNKENERIRLEQIGAQIGAQDFINDIQSPVFIVNGDYSIQWANKKCSDSYQNILNKKCYQVFMGFEDVCPGCSMQECSQNGRQKHLIVKNEREHSTRHVVVHKIPLYRDDQYIGLMEIHYEDVLYTSQHFETLDQIHQLKLELERMNSRNEYLKDFTIGFAKSMKIPLRSYMGFFNLYEDCQNDLLKSDYLQILKSNSDNLYESLNRFLMFSEREHVEIGGMKEAFSIRKIIEETVNQVVLPSQIAQEDHYELDYSETIPDVLVGDALILKNVIAYLLEFIQFISDTEKVLIRVSDVSQSHSKIILKMVMSVNYQFEKNQKLLPYFDLDHNVDFDTVEDYSQALGLMLADKMSKKLNGTLEISTGIEGKLFIELISTYRKVIPKEYHTTKTTETLTKQKKVILIADYEKPNLSLELFRLYDIFFAHTGEEAIQKYFTINPDLMILNVMIEACDGFKVYDEIERRRKEIKPIIAISNKLVDNEREFFRDYGFSDYYPKPLDDAKLKKICDNYF